MSQEVLSGGEDGVGWDRGGFGAQGGLREGRGGMWCTVRFHSITFCFLFTRTKLFDVY